MRYAGVLDPGILAGIGAPISPSASLSSPEHDLRPWFHCSCGAISASATGANAAGLFVIRLYEAVTIQMQGVVKLPSGEDIPIQFHTNGAVSADDNCAGRFHRLITPPKRSAYLMKER